MDQHKANNPYAPPSAAVRDITTEADTAPALWNPNAAANWSLLFSPVFGALVQMKNWQALGDDRRAATSKTWAIICLVITIVAGALTIPLADNQVSLTRPIGLVILITWYVANGKHQCSYVKETFGPDYPRKSWGLPLLYGVLAIIGLGILGGVLGLLMAFFGKT
jgi:hypothetical protein